MLRIVSKKDLAEAKEGDIVKLVLKQNEFMQTFEWYVNNKFIYKIIKAVITQGFILRLSGSNGFVRYPYRDVASL